MPGPAAKKQLLEQVELELQFAGFAPLLWVSGVTGLGIGRILPAVRKVHRAAGVRIQTAELNRFLEQVTTAHAHPAHRGRPVRFYYITQPEARPPTFVISTNVAARAVRVAYRRYIAKKLRERFDFEGTPLRVFFRRRGRSPE
jgi:GTP-binding protein